MSFNKTIEISLDVCVSISESQLLNNTKNVLVKQGFHTLTPIQTQSYEYIYSGVDVIARSRTGSGTFNNALWLTIHCIDMCYTLILDFI